MTGHAAPIRSKTTACECRVSHHGSSVRQSCLALISKISRRRQPSAPQSVFSAECSYTLRHPRVSSNSPNPAASPPSAELSLEVEEVEHGYGEPPPPENPAENSPPPKSPLPQETPPPTPPRPESPPSESLPRESPRPPEALLLESAPPKSAPPHSTPTSATDRHSTRRRFLPRGDRRQRFCTFGRLQSNRHLMASTSR